MKIQNGSLKTNHIYILFFTNERILHGMFASKQCYTLYGK